MARIKGRLQFSEFEYDHKHPIILPNCYVSYLLVRFQHTLLKHAGVNTLISSLRSKYWILGVRRIAKHVTKYCMPCQRQDSRACNQIGAPLPADRVRKAAPFSVTGMDHAGPLYCKDSNTKVYILLFTCGITRAIHLELVSSLNLSEFLLGFRNMVARRGVPEVLYSDQAATFKAASPKLFKLYGAAAPKHKLICPRSPWVGGWWERLVRSVKSALRKTIGSRSLGKKELEVTLAEVEWAINTRPLTSLPSSPRDPGPLTPMHFLRQIGNSSIQEDGVPNVPGLQLQELYTSKQAALNHFWKIWQTQYIANLPPIVRNRKRGPQVQVNDLVLIRDDPPQPRLCWPMGRVINLHYGRDNQVRSVDLQMAKSVLTRPVQRLHRLEVHEAVPSDVGDTADSQKTSPDENVDTCNIATQEADAIIPTQEYTVTQSGRCSRRPDRLQLNFS